MTPMGMPKDVQPGLDPPDFLKQAFAPEPEVTMKALSKSAMPTMTPLGKGKTYRWCMRHQDVRLVGYRSFPWMLLPVVLEAVFTISQPTTQSGKKKEKTYAWLSSPHLGTPDLP